MRLNERKVDLDKETTDMIVKGVQACGIRPTGLSYDNIYKCQRVSEKKESAEQVFYDDRSSYY